MDENVFANNGYSAVDCWSWRLRCFMMLSVLRETYFNKCRYVAQTARSLLDI